MTELVSKFDPEQPPELNSILQYINREIILAGDKDLAKILSVWSEVLVPQYSNLDFNLKLIYHQSGTYYATFISSSNASGIPQETNLDHVGMSRLLHEKVSIELNKDWGGVNFGVNWRKGWIGYTGTTNATQLFTAPEENDLGLVKFLNSNLFTQIMQPRETTRWSFTPQI